MIQTPNNVFFMPVCVLPLQASSENTSNMEMGFTEQVWVSLNII